MKLWLVLTLPLFLLDQLTKRLVLKNIAPHETVPVIPGFFHLVQVHNTGAAFGMLKDNNWFFIGLASVALVVLVVMTVKGQPADRLSRVAVAVLASGVAGNLLDRLLHGYVVDFLDFNLPWYGPWPAFNVADSAICVAAGMFILASFLDGKKSSNAPSSAG